MYARLSSAQKELGHGYEHRAARYEAVALTKIDVSLVLVRSGSSLALHPRD